VNDRDTVYVAVDNHKRGDDSPYLLRSRDRGRTWTSIRGDLPDRHLVWSLEEDHVKPELLFVGTEFGIYFTLDSGSHWMKLEGGVPNIAFRDLAIQRRENDLVGASFGRGFFILDDYSPLREVSPEALEREAILFPVRRARLYVPRAPLGLRGKANLGGAHFTAPNPPFGAVLTYHLGNDLKTTKEVRRDKEKALAKEGKDVPFPGYDELRTESREDEPAIFLEVRDSPGSVVRRVEGPATKGFHRVAWDLRYPPPDPTVLERPELTSPWESYPEGPLVAPGTYRVRLFEKVNGELSPLGEERTFEVVAVSDATLPAQDPTEVLAFRKRTWEARREALAADGAVDEALERLAYMEKALFDAEAAPAELWERLRALELRWKDAKERLSGDPIRARLSEPSVPGILDRISEVADNDWGTTYGPTKTHRDSFAIAERELEGVRDELRGLETDLRALEEALESAGAPWTPGRRPPFF
jgi:hypothetical protein